MPLTEKAYATLNGSYNNIDGGRTCWAFTGKSLKSDGCYLLEYLNDVFETFFKELTGGVAAHMELTWEKVNALGQENFKNFIRRYLAKNGIFCTGNDAETDAVEAYEENGLIQGHAYSLLS